MDTPNWQENLFGYKDYSINMPLRQVSITQTPPTKVLKTSAKDSCIAVFGMQKYPMTQR